MVSPAIPTGMEQLFGTQFFSFVLPWLLVFSIVYGVLSHIGETGMPKSKPARGIIGIVLAFIIAPSLSSWVGTLMEMTGSFVIIIAGILVFVVLLEVLGVKEYKEVPVIGEDGKPTGKTKKIETSIFEAYGKWFAIVFIIIAVLVFIGSGAPEAMGWQISPIISYNYPLLFFLGVIVLIIWWMASE